MPRRVKHDDSIIKVGGKPISADLKHSLQAIVGSYVCLRRQAHLEFQSRGATARYRTRLMKAYQVSAQVPESLAEIFKRQVEARGFRLDAS